MASRLGAKTPIQDLKRPHTGAVLGFAAATQWSLTFARQPQSLHILSIRYDVQMEAEGLSLGR